MRSFTTHPKDRSLPARNHRGDYRTMDDQTVEIYVRHSSGRSLLMFHIPTCVRDSFIQGINNGEFSSADCQAHLELSVLPEWIADADVRALLQSKEKAIHLRIPLAAITASFNE